MFIGDIVVSNGLGVMNSELLKHMFDIQPQARSLYHFVRMWLKNYNLELRSYQLTLLVVFYLQRKNLMPSVEKIQQGLEKKLVNGKTLKFIYSNLIVIILTFVFRLECFFQP